MQRKRPAIGSILIVLGGCAALIALGGCAARRPDSGPSPPPPAERTGQSVYAFVPDRTGSRLELKANEEFRAPYPHKENPSPEYPRPALDAGAGHARAGLRIVIHPDGAVGEVTDSPIVESTAGPWQAAFREAAVAAVRQWRFQPALFRTFEPGEDYDGDGQPDFKRLKVENRLAVYVDVRFDFDIVEGKGVVTGGFPPGPTF